MKNFIFCPVITAFEQTFFLLMVVVSEIYTYKESREFFIQNLVIMVCHQLTSKRRKCLGAESILYGHTFKIYCRKFDNS